MFCSRDKLIGLIAKQNDKSLQVTRTIVYRIRILLEYIEHTHFVSCTINKQSNIPYALFHTRHVILQSGTSHLKWYGRVHLILEMYLPNRTGRALDYTQFHPDSQQLKFTTY